MIRVLAPLLIAAMLLFGESSHAELVVIANPHSGIDKLSKDEVINLYMGRTRKFANGMNAMPIDLNSSENEKAQFYALLVGKEVAEINSYWARLRFSGQGSPPVQAESMEEVLRIVAENKAAIGYVDKKKLDKRVRLIYVFD